MHVQGLLLAGLLPTISVSIAVDRTSINHAPFDNVLLEDGNVIHVVDKAKTFSSSAMNAIRRADSMHDIGSGQSIPYVVPSKSTTAEDGQRLSVLKARTKPGGGDRGNGGNGHGSGGEEGGDNSGPQNGGDDGPEHENEAGNLQQDNGPEHEVGPGDHQQDDGPEHEESGSNPKPKFDDPNLERARIKGDKLNKDLDKAISEDTKEPERKDLEDLGYELKGMNKVPMLRDRYLNDLKINVENKETWRKRITTRPEISSEEPLFAAVTDPHQQVIVVKESWKRNDVSNPTATWTDFIDEAWMSECARTEQDPKSLKYIVRDNIQGEQEITDSSGIKLDTPKAIQAALKLLDAENKMSVEIDAKSSDPKVKAAYQLLSAQTHLARVLQWLKDRHSSLGNKKVVALYIHHAGPPPSYFHMVIKVA